MEQSCLEIGKIVNTHGLKGEVKIVPWADYPEIFEEIEFLVLADGKRRIEWVKYHKSGVILKLEGINSHEEALSYKNKIVKVLRSEIGEPPEGSYYITDLIGLDVFCGENFLGTVSDILNHGSADIYVIKKDGEGDILFPAAKENIVEISLETGRITVKMPEGLLELYRD